MEDLTYSGRSKDNEGRSGKESYLSQFNAFLNWLLDISRSDYQEQEGYLFENPIPLFVFVSKKGYWIYRLIEHFLCQNGTDSPWEQALKNKTIEVKSDRYFTKMISCNKKSQQLTNRQIYVVDDFLRLGRNIQRFCDLIEKMETGCTVTPVVFAQWEGFRAEEQMSREFLNLRSFYPQVSLRTIGSLSIWETQEFHRVGIPYVIDLPFLTVADADCQKNEFFSIELETEKFQRLRENVDSPWRCMDISYPIGDYYAGSCFFFCENDPFLDKFRYLVQNFVIKCAYNYNTENNTVSLTLIPFAILRSIRQDELICRFFIVFSGTEYGKMITQYLGNPEVTTEDDKLNTALYRAIVFFFSWYTAINFKNFLYDQVGLEIDFDREELRDHWSQEFINSLSDVFGYSLEERLNRLYEKNDIVPYTPSPREELIQRSDSMYYNIFAYFAFARMSNRKQGDFCSFEELENAMAKNIGCSVDDLKFKETFTATILQLLDQGVISNQISYDQDTGVVQRGFRSGENSTLILPFNQKAIFRAVYTYYMRMCEEENRLLEKDQRVIDSLYHKYYSMFKLWLVEFIKDTELDSYFDVREACDILSYFGEIEADVLEQQMENKRYIIDELEQSNSTEAKVSRILEQCVWRMNFI